MTDRTMTDEEMMALGVHEAEIAVDRAMAAYNAARENLLKVRSAQEWAPWRERPHEGMTAHELGERIADCARAHEHGKTDGPWYAMRRAIASLVARAEKSA